jgi:hypothetical protein
MKINPSNKEIYTDSGTFLKRLHCPIGVMWNHMKENGSNTRMCSGCEKTIHDTEHLSDAELEYLLTNDPQACLKVNLNQNNVKIFH